MDTDLRSPIGSSRHRLRIAARVRATRVLGPGLRYALWVQGCPFACPGCIAPEFLPVEGGREIAIVALAREILDTPGVAGVTLSGGEPFAQAAGLAHLLDRVARDRPDLTVICYSGFTRAQLEGRTESDDGVRRLLQRLDVLIDGQYRHELNDSRGLRGSANQAVHFLSGRIPPDRSLFETATRRTESLDDEDGLPLEVGVPDLVQWKSSHCLDND
jgi:anaerobic ribonucleoside-triphosphate reductase activating protein